MACEHVQLPGGGTAIVCGLRRPKPKPCSHPGCKAPGNKLCDWPIAPGKTCDKPICNRHAVQVGEDTDYCRGHEERYVTAMDDGPDDLPATLADIGHGTAWLMRFHCLTCGHFIGPAWAVLREKLGIDYPLTRLLTKLSCDRCKVAGRKGESAIVIHRTSALGLRATMDRQYQLRQGRDWEPFASP